MNTHLYSTVSHSYDPKAVWKAFPWSNIILSFFMISSFLIFATNGTAGFDTLTTWTTHVIEILAGTAIFSLATILLIWAARMLPKNF